MKKHVFKIFFALYILSAVGWRLDVKIGTIVLCTLLFELIENRVTMSQRIVTGAMSLYFLTTDVPVKMKLFVLLAIPIMYIALFHERELGTRTL